MATTVSKRRVHLRSSRKDTAREALSDYATSKTRLAQIRQAEADLKAKAITGSVAV